MVRASRLKSDGNNNPKTTSTDSGVKLPKILQLQQQQQQQQNTPTSDDSTPPASDEAGSGVRSTVDTTSTAPVAKKQTKTKPTAVVAAARPRPPRAFEKKTSTSTQQTPLRPPAPPASDGIEEVPLRDFGSSLAASFSDYTNESCVNPSSKSSTRDNPSSRGSVANSTASLLDRVMDKLEKGRANHIDTSLIYEKPRRVPQPIDQKSIAIYAAIVALCFLTLIMLGIAAFMVFIR